MNWSKSDLTIEHSPWSPWSRRLYYVNDVLPKVYHDQYKGWTIDGSYDHRTHPNSPWPLIENLGLHWLILADIEQADKLIAIDQGKVLRATLSSMLDTIAVVRNELRDAKDFTAADKLRDVLKKFGYETQDVKVKNGPA